MKLYTTHECVFTSFTAPKIPMKKSNSGSRMRNIYNIGHILHTLPIFGPILLAVWYCHRILLTPGPLDAFLTKNIQILDVQCLVEPANALVCRFSR